MATEGLDVDDIVVGKVAELLGAGQVPTKAVLIVETMGEEGTGLQMLRSMDLPTWQALGMLRSAQLRLEQADLASWDES